jgi:hypothetical protein
VLFPRGARSAPEERRHDGITDLGATTSATINAPIDEVWRELTTLELIKQWFFGVDTETDWRVGSPLIHRGVYQGKPYLDKGEIVRSIPRGYSCIRTGATSREGPTSLSITRR